jgi:hypothetical protein
MVLHVITGLTEVELWTPTYETPCYKIWVLVSKLGDPIKSKGELQVPRVLRAESLLRVYGLCLDTFSSFGHRASLRQAAPLQFGLCIGNYTKFYNLQNYNKSDIYWNYIHRQASEVKKCGSVIWLILLPV